MQSALGPAQNFYLGHVKQGAGTAQAAEVDAINNQADRGVQRFLKLAALAYSPDLEKTCARGAAGEIDVGCKGQYALQVLRLTFPNVPGADNTGAAHLIH